MRGDPSGDRQQGGAGDEGDQPWQHVEPRPRKHGHAPGSDRLQDAGEEGRRGLGVGVDARKLVVESTAQCLVEPEMGQCPVACGLVSAVKTSLRIAYELRLRRNVCFGLSARFTLLLYREPRSLFTQGLAPHRLGCGGLHHTEYHREVSALLGRDVGMGKCVEASVGLLTRAGSDIAFKPSVTGWHDLRFGGRWCRLDLTEVVKPHLAPIEMVGSAVRVVIARCLTSEDDPAIILGDAATDLVPEARRAAPGKDNGSAGNDIAGTYAIEQQPALSDAVGDEPRTRLDRVLRAARL